MRRTFKKYREYKRKQYPEGFMSDFHTQVWFWHTNMISRAHKQPFYTGGKERKHSRKAYKMIKRRAYNAIRDRYKERGEW